MVLYKKEVSLKPTYIMYHASKEFIIIKTMVIIRI